MQKLQNHFKSILAFSAICILGVFAYKYFQKPPGIVGKAGGAPVVVQQAKLQDVPITFSYPARITGYRNVAVLSQVDGVLKDILFAPGQMVEEDADLFQIDPIIYLESVKDAEGKLQVAQANLWQTERAFERANKLYKVKAVSLEELDIATANLKKAQSAVIQAQADVVKAQTNLSYTLVKAPVSGMVSKESQSVGSLISTRPDSNLLTYIVQTDPVYINFSFPTSEFMKRKELMKKGKLYSRNDEELEVAIKINNDLYDFKGKLSFVDNFIDLQTQSIKARAEVDNPSNKLIPGVFVTAIVEGLNYKKVALIPDQAIIQSKEGAFLYVVKGGKATMKKVDLGEMIKNNRIIREGLEEGDQVIIEGMIKVRPFSEVTISKVISN
jgi:membrane fusion protein (multidrug efflux system)